MASISYFDSMPQPSIYLHLQQIPLLQGLPSPILQNISAHLHVRYIKRNQWILRKDSAGDQLFFLLSGKLQVIDTSHSGREVGLSFISPKEYFGELSVIDGLPRTSSVLAITDSEVATLPRYIALDLMHNQSSVAKHMLENMAKTIRNANAYRAILAMTNVTERVGAILERMVSLAPGGLYVIDPLPKQQEIAIMINTSRETVSRVMKTMMEQSIIEKDFRRLIIRNMQALKKYSNNSQENINI